MEKSTTKKENIEKDLRASINSIIENDGKIEKGEKGKGIEADEPTFTPEGVNYFGIFLPRIDEAVPMERARESSNKTVWWDNFKTNARTMAACLKVNTPLYLEGPAGVGKTFFAEQMSAGMGLPLYRMNGPKYRMAESLFLEKDVRTNEKGPLTLYTPTPLLIAMKEGGVILLDEANIIKSDTLAELNIFDRNPIKITDSFGKLIEWPDGKIEKFPEEFVAHPNFRIILAGNLGKHFHGIKDQNLATLSRFHQVNFERISVEEIEKILRQRLIKKLGPEASLKEIKRVFDSMQPILEIAKLMMDKINKIEESPDTVSPELSIYEGAPEMNPRILIRYLYLVMDGLRPEEVMEDYIVTLGRTNPEAAKVIKKTFKEYLTPKKK